MPAQAHDRLVLLADITRLRRAESALVAGAARDDVAEVRRHLEDRLGRTVSRAFAARALAISQTALDRWIASHDIPVVMTPAGRYEVPRRVLVELVEEVREHPGARRPLAAVMRRRRAAAAALTPEAIALPTGARTDPHGLPTARARAYHRAVARQLDDATLAGARERLARWRLAGSIDERLAEAWEDILRRPVDDVAAAIAGDLTASLLQSSPFAGTLTEQERARVLELVAVEAAS